MTDHHDTTEDDTTVPYASGDTRFDVHRTDFDAPTAPYKRVPPPVTRIPGQPYVSPPGAHTGGSAGPRGIPYPDTRDAPRVTDAVEVINHILDERETPKARRRARRVRTAPTLREVAERRELEKLRRERHLEHLEVARAWMTLAILIGLFLLVVGAGVVGYGILSGWFEWVPRRTR